MNLLARPTEKAIRAAARRELHADDATWREFKRRRQRIKPLVMKGVAALGYLAIPFIALVSLQRAALTARAGWAVLILCVGVSAGVATWLQLVIKRTTHLERLPLLDRDIFRVTWRDLVMAALWTLPAFWCFFHWLEPGSERNEVWLQGAAALLLTGTLLASVCIAIVWLRTAQWGQWVMNFAWFGLVFGIQVAGDTGHPMVREIVDQIATGIRFTTPPGWVVTWFIERPTGEVQAALWLVPVALSFVAAAHAWQRLRDTFTVHEAAPSMPQLTPAQALAVQLVTLRKEFPTPHLHGATAVDESLKARAFLQLRPGLDAGWLDRLILRWLTERERVLLDFMLLVLPKWTKGWQLGLAVGFGGLVLAELIRPARPNDFVIASVVGGIGLIAFALPVASGLSRAFTSCPAAGGAPLTFAGCLPFSYAEVVRMDLKICVSRALAVLPVVLAFGAVVAWQIKAPPSLGALIGFKVLLLMVAFRPFMIAAHFSAGTNDSQLSRLRGWVMVGGAIVVTFVLIGLGFGSIMMTAWWNCLSVPAFALVSWGSYAIHRRCYDRMVFDLQPSTVLGQHPVG